jgi:hypothetical protein
MTGARARWFAGATVLAVLAGALLLRRETTVPSAAPSATTGSSSAARELPDPVTSSAEPEPRAEPAETSDDPRAIVASLEALGSTYAARSTRKPAPDAELERVLVKHLESEHDAVVRAALTTARVSLMTEPPQAGVVAAIVELTGKDEATSRRAAGLEALHSLRPDRRSGDVLSAFQTALDAEEPELVSLGLLALSQSGPSLAGAPEVTRTALGERVVALLGHGNPGVRGRALLVLAELPELVTEEKRFAAGKHGLLDREPYVCAQAADLLARTRKAAAIHGLIEQVRDLRAARYELRGSAGVLLHEVPGRRRVAEAALFAIQSLGETVSGAERLTLTLRDRYTDDPLVLENAEAAKAWYRSLAGRIPREP